MASINYAAREISVKIVYYGPGLSGKTTNLQIIHRKVPKEYKSEMVSLATETDRTLFFDFLPLNLGKIKGFTAKFQLYTVPGQVYYSVTRKLVLRGVDGIVFVADSSAAKLNENLESFQNMEDNLAEYGYKREEIPIILQYNKRDLPDAMGIDDLQKKINKYNLIFTEAVATKGEGVFESLKLIGKTVIDELNRKYAKKPSPALPGRTIQPPVYSAPSTPVPAQQAPAPAAPAPFTLPPRTAVPPQPHFMPPNQFAPQAVPQPQQIRQPVQSFDRYTPSFVAQVPPGPMSVAGFTPPPPQPQSYSPAPAEQSKSALDLEIERYQSQISSEPTQPPSPFSPYAQPSAFGQQAPQNSPYMPQQAYPGTQQNFQASPAQRYEPPAPPEPITTSPQAERIPPDINRSTPTFRSPFPAPHDESAKRTTSTYYIANARDGKPRQSRTEDDEDMPKKKGFLGKLFGKN